MSNLQTIRDMNGNIIARDSQPNISTTYKPRTTPQQIIEMMLAKVDSGESIRYVIGKNDLVRAKVLITQHQYKFNYVSNASGGFTITKKS